MTTPYSLSNLQAPYSSLSSSTPKSVFPAPNPANSTPISPITPTIPTQTPAPSPTPAPVAPTFAAPQTPAQQTPESHTVAQGDTLSKIASNYGLSINEVLSINPQYKANPNLIRPGEVINLSGLSSLQPQAQNQQNRQINPATGGYVETPAASAQETAPAPAPAEAPTPTSYATPSAEEISLGEEADAIRESLQKGYLGEGQRPIALGFITGRQKALEDRALGLITPIENKLKRIQDERLAKLDANKPVSLSSGETLVNPITGEVVSRGSSSSEKQAIETFYNLQQTYPDAAIQYDPNLSAEQNLALAQQSAAQTPNYQAKGTIVTVNPLTGQPIVISKGAGGSSGYSIFGAGNPAGAGAGTSGVASTLPAELQGALSNVGGIEYFDQSKVTSGQLPYLQRSSVETGIPILSKEDANKVQDAVQSFTSAKALIGQISTLASSVLTAGNNAAEQTKQTATLKAIEKFPYLSTNSNAKEFISARNSMLSLLTRAAGEKGVLTTQDVDRIGQAMPSYGDSAELAAKKAQNFESVINSVLTGAIQAYIGSVGGKSTGTGGSSTGSFSGVTSSGLKYTVTQ